MVKALMVIAALVLAGCVSKPDSPSPSDPRSVWCEHNSPRRDARPHTPRTELNDINRHNTQGEKWCGWKP